MICQERDTIPPPSFYQEVVDLTATPVSSSPTASEEEAPTEEENPADSEDYETIEDIILGFIAEETREET